MDLVEWSFSSRPDALPAASSRLPYEIIQYIYTFLHPRDFDAARHACRSWMLASMNRFLLTEMHRRGGHWSSMEQEMVSRPSISR